MADVGDLLEQARRTASLAGVPPLVRGPTAGHTQDNDTQHQGASQDDHPQELIVPTLDTEQLQVYGPNTNSGDDTSDEKTRPTLDTEQQKGDNEHDADSGDDPPDLAWEAPGPGGDTNTGSRAITRARDNQV